MSEGQQGEDNPSAPSREEIDAALDGAIDDAAVWIETFEHNEWNDPNYPEAAATQRRHKQVLEWLRGQYDTLPTLRAEIKTLQVTVGFFASVIKSGEPWTEACQEARDKVFGPQENV